MTQAALTDFKPSRRFITDVEPANKSTSTSSQHPKAGSTSKLG
jgi:hypothetical protein